MKRTGRVDHSGAPGASSRKLDHRFDTFASGAAEKTFLQPPAASLAQLRRKLARQFWDVALQHRRTEPRKFRLQGTYYARMIVPRVVNAIPGKEIQNATAVISKQLDALAALVSDIHLQQVKQIHPLGIYVPAVKI
jgi:hypothetical protein